MVLRSTERNLELMHSFEVVHGVSLAYPNLPIISQSPDRTLSVVQEVHWYISSRHMHYSCYT